MLATLNFKRSGKPDVSALQQGVHGRAPGGRAQRLGIEASWATNPENLGKALYNPALLPMAWGYLYKPWQCYWCFKKWEPSYSCDHDAMWEVLSLEVSPNKFALLAPISDLNDLNPTEQTMMEDKSKITRRFRENWNLWDTDFFRTYYCSIISCCNQCCVWRYRSSGPTEKST